MLVELVKLAYSLDAKKEYDMAREIDAMIAELVQRTGLDQKDMLALANYLDEQGEAVLADKLDALVSEAKGKYKTWKGKGKDKPPHKDRPRPPKAWFEKMKKDVKKKNPDYSTKRVEEIVSDIWHNELSDAKVKSEMSKK